MNNRDITIKRFITDFGPLTREQLMALAYNEKSLGAPSTLWRRLLKNKPLRAGKYIHVWEAPTNEKYVYASYDISRRKDFAHDLITSWVHITLHNSFNLVFWQRAKEKYSSALNEDAYLILANPNVLRDGRPTENHYYLESDTGSEGYAQIEAKLERYIKQYERERKAFFVFFVTANEQRAKDLARRASRVVPREKRKLYLFTSLQSLRSNPTGNICYVAHDEGAYPVLPNLVK